MRKVEYIDVSKLTEKEAYEVLGMSKYYKLKVIEDRIFIAMIWTEIIFFVAILLSCMR